MVNVLQPSDVEYRREIKAPLDAEQYFELIDFIDSALSPIRKTYPDRYISSIYYDNPVYKDYLENVSGQSIRSKTRVRWYDSDYSTAVLEFKSKINKTTAKHKINLNASIFDSDFKGESLKNILHSLGYSDIAHGLELLYPTVKVTYDRRYFELISGIRLTLDKNIQYSIFHDNNYFLNKLHSPVYAVLEIKFFNYDADLVNDFLNDLPIRFFRHSKYVIGIDMLYK